ncbi:hypothetical protein MLD38_022827 [Melastoma candidum]|uniref:Uncharacterized protein n=1 Tax=Melastoma candidum TaxID=119954 RepID=A0ACB9QLR6_9MYRT|nr:hypothetical protein MLD38_022827 [Melastoma candidum]
MPTAKIQPTACATLRQLRTGLGLGVPGRGHLTVIPRRRRVRHSSTTVVMSALPIDVCAKASLTVPNKLGDCPFCQRLLLTLEEKQLPYDIKLIEFSNKPEWFSELNPDGFSRVEDIFDIYWLPKEQDPSDGTEQALLAELSSFNDHIKENGPFINGKEISAADLSLGPKLYLLEIALGHYKNWSVPDSLPYVKSYMQDVFSRDSFVKTRALKEDVVEGWRPKVMG